MDDFLNEVVFITKMKHRNLVDLKGYYMRGKERMPVYKFVENTDVEQSLLRKSFLNCYNFSFLQEMNELLST